MGRSTQNIRHVTAPIVYVYWVLSVVERSLPARDRPPKWDYEYRALSGESVEVEPKRTEVAFESTTPNEREKRHKEGENERMDTERVRLLTAATGDDEAGKPLRECDNEPHEPEHGNPTFLPRPTSARDVHGRKGKAVRQAVHWTDP